MLGSSVMDLAHGFGVALAPGNLMWCFVGVTIGNLVGVLPGMGVMSAVSILLPLTFGMPPVAAILMLSGIFYGAQYGGAICSILLNMPTHPPHAVTCLDGYPMTLRGKAGTALGITMLAALVGAAFGITEMVLFAPAVANLALKFGAVDMCALMLLGLLTGSTLARGSPLKGVAMTLVGLLLGIVGTDVSSGVTRFDFGRIELQDGVELVALALGLFGVAEFLKSINHRPAGHAPVIQVRMRDMLPSRSEVRTAAFPIMRGTLIGALCSLMPGTGPTIASFVSYSVEKRISRTPGRFGHGAIEGVAAPEASTHSAVQADFIPTMSLGIPGDAVMALLLGALMIQGITPGPLLVVEHPDIFWGLIASFWTGNLMLVFLNVPLIGLWVKLLRVPHRYLFPAALFFTYIGVFASRTMMFDVGTVMAFGVAGYGLFRLGFEPAPILLGFVLGPRLEENFRRAMLLADGDLATFVQSPLSATVLGLCALMIAAQIVLRVRRVRAARAPVLAT
jgi:putative tricarboxylic transport membrane protein